ncbi:hypothetical protein [Thermococcus sp.]|uniref:hypothetical protein n=1 Tax=Thermococcus sp. TaxID=35749 RepID=UPI00261C79A7|nr:hypothetical protein [Thermococcus sp.]
MFEWQALSNFFIAVAVGAFLVTMAQFVSLDLVIQLNLKSKDVARALFIATWMVQTIIIALMMTQFTPVHSSNPIYTVFSIWVFAVSFYLSVRLSQIIPRWWGYV